MTAARTYALDDTQPIPRVCFGMLRQNWQVGDRVTDVVMTARKPLRLIGRVCESDTHVFRVRWDGGHGVATYTHSHEPDTLRRPTEADEEDASADGDLLTLASVRGREMAAAELRRLAFDHPEWSTGVRAALNRRAQELSA